MASGMNGWTDRWLDKSGGRGSEIERWRARKHMETIPAGTFWVFEGLITPKMALVRARSRNGCSFVSAVVGWSWLSLYPFSG